AVSSDRGRARGSGRYRGDDAAEPKNIKARSMSTLVLELRPGEMMIVNGAPIRFRTKTRIELTAKARFLFGKQIMPPNEVDSPARTGSRRLPPRECRRAGGTRRRPARACPGTCRQWAALDHGARPRPRPAKLSARRLASHDHFGGENRSA